MPFSRSGVYPQGQRDLIQCGSRMGLATSVAQAATSRHHIHVEGRWLFHPFPRAETIRGELRTIIVFSNRVDGTPVCKLGTTSSLRTSPHRNRGERRNVLDLG